MSAGRLDSAGPPLSTDGPTYPRPPAPGGPQRILAAVIQLLIPLMMVAVMVMLFRSNKKRQEQARTMQSTLEPGAGVRTIGGLYAQVKAVNDETVELEIAPGVVTHFTKGAIAAVLEPLEYDAIINGRPLEDEAEESITEADDEAEAAPLSLEKDDSGSAPADSESPKSK
ncbi:preprotein translocase subunit YajC [Kitasatospora paranensis]